MPLRGDNVVLLDLSIGNALIVLELTTVGSGVVRDSEKSEVTDLDDFRPRITMGNPIVTEILGFSDVGFSKNEKFSAKKSKK